MKRIILLVFICITSWTFTSFAQDNEKRYFFKNFRRWKCIIRMDALSR